MQLGAPNNLFLLGAVEVLAVGFVLLAQWRRRAALRFSGERAVAGSGGGYWLRATLVVLAATLAVVAMARPQWGSKEFSRQEQGIDLVIALDISESMTARDVAPSRLGAAQAELSRLLDGMRGSRVGLVFFAGSAFLRSPLSTDTQALADIVNRANNEPGLTRAGSDIGAALDQAERILDASDSPGKAVLVVSDGEDFGTTAGAKAAELAQKGVAVFTAGAGTPQGSNIQQQVGNTTQTRVKVDAAGQAIITRLDEAKLQAVAGAGKGRYVRITGSGTNLLSLRDDLNQLQQAPLSERTQKVPVDRLQLFVATALGVLALAWFVPDRLPRLRFPRLRPLRPRPGIALLLLALIAGGGCGAKDDPVRSRNADANKLFDAGQYAQALDAYQKLLAERPDLPEIAYNTGNTLDRLGQFDRAVEETRRALPPTTTKLGMATFYALGNHYLGLNQLDDAYESYKSALLLDPGDKDAKYNLEVVLLRMNQQNAPQQQQGQQQGGPPDSQQQPGDGQTPQDQAQPSGGNTDQGQAPTAQPAPGSQQQQPSQADVQRQLQDALRGLDQDVSFDEAVRILDLLQQLRQQRQQGPASAPSGSPDY